MSATVITPERSYDQRIQALGRANVTRSFRCQLKRDLKARRVLPVDVLTDPPVLVATMRVMDVLLAVPLLGRSKVTRLLKMAEVSPVKTIGGLSERQRGALVSLLGVGR